VGSAQTAVETPEANPSSTSRKMKSLLQSIYNQIPAPLRYGSLYRTQRALIRRTSTFTESELTNWQLTKLREVLLAAYRHTPYYRELFDRVSFRPDRFSALEDLQSIPLLTKSKVISMRDAFKSDLFSPDDLRLATTGGTTGVPLGVFYHQRTQGPIENAFIHEIWGRFGFKDSRRMVWARVSKLNGQLYERRGQKLVVDCGQLQRSTFSAIVEAIRYFRPSYLFGYPSSLYLLAQLMLQEGQPAFESIELVMCSSETLDQAQLASLRGFFHAPVCNLYGNSERTVIAANTPACHHMHFYPQYGFVEILNQDGKPCSAEGERGEIITTAFTSPAFPLIRYRTGDYASFSSRRCSCNWNYLTVSEIQGRAQEFLVDVTGERRPFIASVNMHSSVFTPVFQFQLVQPSPGLVDVCVVPKREFADADAQAIALELGRILGAGFEVRVQKVERMRLTSRGKFRFVIHDPISLT
jgi:phenylacetate-CoA ligase